MLARCILRSLRASVTRVHRGLRARYLDSGLRDRSGKRAPGGACLDRGSRRILERWPRKRVAIEIHFAGALAIASLGNPTPFFATAL